MPKLTLQRMVTLAMLVALSIIIGKFSIAIVPKQLVIGFTFIVNAIIGMIGGPLWGFLALGMIDLLKTLLGGTSDFTFLWTLGEAFIGLLYGAFFYKKQFDWHSYKSWAYMTLAVSTIVIVQSFIINPLLLLKLYKISLATQFFILGRWMKIFEIPLRTIVLMFILPALQRIPELRKLSHLSSK